MYDKESAMKTILTILVVMMAVSMTGFAADKPNFSGEWTLDASKSEFGPMPPPSSMTRKVDHNDPNLTYTQSVVGSPQGDQTTTMKYSTDGKETTNDMMGNALKTVAKWDGNALVINGKVDFGGTEITLSDKWTLSEDGKVLTDALHIDSPQGAFDITYVLNKK
jgi:hypothetical protein